MDKSIFENEDGTLTLPTQFFIVFAEYLGYVSDFSEEAIKWCDGTKPKDEVVKLLEVESSVFYEDMLKEYSKEEIREWYNLYKPIIFDVFEEEYAKATLNHE